MPEIRDALVIVIGTLYGPPPTRNGVAGGVTRIWAWPIPALAGGTSVGVGLELVVGYGNVGGVTAAAPPGGGGGGGGGAGSGGAGVTTKPGTGDEPGGT